VLYIRGLAGSVVNVCAEGEGSGVRTASQQACAPLKAPALKQPSVRLQLLLSVASMRSFTYLNEQARKLCLTLSITFLSLTICWPLMRAAHISGGRSELSRRAAEMTLCCSYSLAC
jgi:hypothetical protein